MSILQMRRVRHREVWKLTHTVSLSGGARTHPWALRSRAHTINRCAGAPHFGVPTMGQGLC